MYRNRIALGGGALAAAVITVAGCGSSGASNQAKGDPFQLVAAAADTTAAAKNARISFDVKIDTSSQDVSLNGEGVVDLQSNKLRLTFKLPSEAGSGTLTEVAVGGIFYVQLPEEARGKADGKSWISVDPSKITGASMGSSSNSFSQDPTDILNSLKSVSNDVTVVGSEDVRGAKTTHYRADVDLQKAIKQSGAKSSFVEQAQKLLGNATLPEDVYIDSEGRVRRVSLDIEPASGSTAAAALKSESFTIDFYDFGKADTSGIAAPPASDTIDASELSGFSLGG